MKLKYKSYILLLGAFLATSCSDNDDWQPGESEEDTAGVFFRAIDKYDYTLEADDSRIIPVTLGRANADEAVTVPIEVKTDLKGVVYPSEVSFAAGEDSVTIDIDLTETPSKTAGDIAISLDSRYTTLYGAGSSSFSIHVNIAGSWLVLADDLKVDILDSNSNSVYPTENTKLYFLDGSDRFKIPDFMNSGVDFIFTLDSPSSTWSALIPYTNYMDYSDAFPGESYGYDVWYLYDTANSSYPVWSPDGTEPKITSAIIYYDYEWSYIGIQEGYGSLSVDMGYEDGSYSWNYVDLTFSVLFDPFATVE